VPLKLIMILFYAHWEIKGGLYQNLPINATEIPQLAYACDRTKPMAEKLSSLLEEVNLSVVACEEGKALGEGTDIRVFDVQHIKGLEFEAVFFAGIDKLAEEKPGLFDRYLYVGTTRAATYLGLVCYDSLPRALEPLRDCFDPSWETQLGHQR